MSIEIVITTSPISPESEAGIEYLRDDDRGECRSILRVPPRDSLYREMPPSPWRIVDRRTGAVRVVGYQPVSLSLPDEDHGWRWIAPLVIDVPSVHPARGRACSPRAGRRASMLHAAARLVASAGGQRLTITPSQRLRQRA